MYNIPDVKMGIVAVSRNCFPIDLSIERRRAIIAECAKRDIPIIEIETTIENEHDTLKALDELKAAGVNALTVFLGNFGPEGPETMLAEKFDGPAMYVAAAEENIQVLSSRRGDAYCGMLNASYNLKLRGVNAYIPERPVGDAKHVTGLIAGFYPIARAAGRSRLEGHHVRPASVRLPGLQRAHRAAVQAGRRRAGEQRA